MDNNLICPEWDSLQRRELSLWKLLKLGKSLKFSFFKSVVYRALKSYNFFKKEHWISIILMTVFFFILKISWNFKFLFLELHANIINLVYFKHKFHTVFRARSSIYLHALFIFITAISLFHETRIVIDVALRARSIISLLFGGWLRFIIVKYHVRAKGSYPAKSVYIVDSSTKHVSCLDVINVYVSERRSKF